MNKEAKVRSDIFIKMLNQSYASLIITLITMTLPADDQNYLLNGSSQVSMIMDFYKFYTEKRQYYIDYLIFVGSRLAALDRLEMYIDQNFGRNVTENSTLKPLSEGVWSDLGCEATLVLVDVFADVYHIEACPGENAGQIIKRLVKGNSGAGRLEIKKDIASVSPTEARFIFPAAPAYKDQTRPLYIGAMILGTISIFLAVVSLGSNVFPYWKIAAIRLAANVIGISFGLIAYRKNRDKAAYNSMIVNVVGIALIPGIPMVILMLL